MVDELYSTVLGLNFKMCTISTRDLDTFILLEIIELPIPISCLTTDIRLWIKNRLSTAILSIFATDHSVITTFLISVVVYFSFITIKTTATEISFWIFYQLVPATYSCSFIVELSSATVISCGCIVFINLNRSEKIVEDWALRLSRL